MGKLYFLKSLNLKISQIYEIMSFRIRVIWTLLNQPKVYHNLFVLSAFYSLSSTVSEKKIVHPLEFSESQDFPRKSEGSRENSRVFQFCFFLFFWVYSKEEFDSSFFFTGSKISNIWLISGWHRIPCRLVKSRR